MWLFFFFCQQGFFFQKGKKSKKKKTRERKREYIFYLRVLLFVVNIVFKKIFSLKFFLFFLVLCCCMLLLCEWPRALGKKEKTRRSWRRRRKKNRCHFNRELANSLPSFCFHFLGLSAKGVSFLPDKGAPLPSKWSLCQGRSLTFNENSTKTHRQITKGYSHSYKFPEVCKGLGRCVQVSEVHGGLRLG